MCSGISLVSLEDGFPLFVYFFENRPIAYSKYSNNDIMRLMVVKGVDYVQLYTNKPVLLPLEERRAEISHVKVFLESSLPCRTTALFLAARPTVRRLSACLFTSFQPTLLFVVCG